MWSQFPLRLCMAAMAPALTDAAAHTGSFKLPASPANPGSSGGLHSNPNQPTSPDLPSLANGHSPAVPGIIGKHYSPSPTTTRLRNHEETPSPTCFTIRTHFLENNNHTEGETVTRISEEKTYRELLSSNHCKAKGPIKNKLNSLISTIGSGIDLDLLVTNGERHSTKQSIQKTMNDSAAPLAQKEVLNDNHPCTSSASKMPPLTISATGSPSPTGAKHSVAAHIENINIRDNGDISEHGELDTSDTSSSSLSNDMDSSLSLSLSNALTTDTSLEQVVDDPLDAKSDDESDSDDSSVDLPAIIPAEKKSETCHRVEEKEKGELDPGVDKQEDERKCSKSKQARIKEVGKSVFKVVIDNGQTTDEEKKEVTNLGHKQSKQEHRAKYLMEKLRRLETCHVGSRIYQQIGSFVESKQSSKEAANSAASSTVTCEECRRNRLQTGSRPGVLPRSSSSHSHTCPLHTNSSSDRQRHSVRPSWLPAGKRTKTSTHISQHLREGKQAYREVKSVTGRLRAGLGHVESTIDSDVTDSSSGGESCDEGDDSLPQTQASRSFHKMPLHRRASWKWAMDRSAIAARWTWLQAQVSDLEYRIRQQSDIFRQIRATKGAVSLGEPPSPEEYLRAQALAHRTGRKLSPLETKIVLLEGSHSMSPSNLSSLLSNVDKQSAKLKQSLQNCISPTSTSSSTCSDKTSPARPMNGLTDSATTVATPSSRCGMNSSPSYSGVVGLDQVAGSPIPVEEQYCARTRPVRPFRKRKLIRSTGLYQVCRKAQKLSTVQCGCFPPHTPCVMCGGRFNNVEQHDADQIPSDERVASLEYAFHSVLSFPEEIPLTLHFESLLKSGAWQRKHSARSQGKKKHNRLPNRSKVKLHTKDGRLKKFRKKEKHQQKQLTVRSGGDPTRKRELVTKKEARDRNVYPQEERVEKEEGSANEEDDDAAKSRKLLHRLARQTALEKSRERSMSLPNIEVGDHNSAPSTPASIEARSPTQHLSHSLPSASLHGILRNKKGMVESYDIDNIVIPYSMLASTRVVKLNYKEIVTPKWRELDMDEFMANNHNEHQEKEESRTEDEESRMEDEDEEEEEYFEENLSDDEFLERHDPCEYSEKKKFMVVSHVDLGMPGRRSRRSRNSSIGSATDPLSPDLHIDQLSTGRQSSTSSPTPSPSPITTPDQLSSSTSSNVFNLSGSRSLRFSALNRRRSSSMSEVQTPNQVVEGPVPVNELTWVKRQFPLNSIEIEEISTYPYPESEPSTRPSSRASNATHSESVISRTESQEMNLYMSDGENSETEPMEVDDPNDPEWTVVEDQHRPRKLEGSTMSESLVMKFAKR
ncbi:KAT8 regulatory NSL complex subunit 1 isoform X2 [Strongylocentrotus purpuratus]|uniref:PEHE domain-containing protein n=1 Tax=Strongylocentrotus purpuratus TaxID=7668 RepID=A0A7M7HHU8_STRPU|nr:KAT8 regulatory NSL complex subunit 1 isoform X2 [Strongylocentrotus purpuratus]